MMKTVLSVPVRVRVSNFSFFCLYLLFMVCRPLRIECNAISGVFFCSSRNFDETFIHIPPNIERAAQFGRGSNDKEGNWFKQRQKKKAGRCKY